jgi:transposase-like protein
MSVLSKPYFYDEAEAFKKLESLIWPNGPVCPKCGHSERIYDLKGVRSKPSKKNPKGVERHGLKKCGKCRKQFTARVGTVFESSHVPLHKWLQAVFLMCSSKKGISSHQLHRVLEVKYQTAWFMTHRVREAMRHGTFATPMGGKGGVVEADETYIGDNKRYRGFAHRKTSHHAKHTVLTLVDRDGEARSFHVDRTDARSVLPIVEANIAKEATVMTDEGGHYRPLKRVRGDKHQSVNHSAGEYGRGLIHTNTVEGYFSIFKRGMKGVYQHCSEKHLHRYLAEFDFRYSNRIALGVDDEARADKALKGIVGKRLTYQQPS